MKIVVDSGSTKADWIMFGENDKCNGAFATLGLNPEVLTKEELENRMILHPDIQQIKNTVDRIYFYGSGCGTPRSKEMMENALRKIFTNATYFEIREDTYAATYATALPGEQAIICINGTGSNCSFFDGAILHQAVDSLGYLVMDDCSGCDFGRQLLHDFYVKKMPKELRILFKERFDIDSDVVKNHLYKMENPNAYLASFLPFILEHHTEVYCLDMIRHKIQYFVDYYIKQFEQYQSVPIHFVGSIGYLFQKQFKEVILSNGLQFGKVVQKPLDGLIKYHKH